MAGGTHDAAGGHALWVRLIHWWLAASVLLMVYSGIVILLSNPRLYWGWAGNPLMKPLIELPLGPNYHDHGAWEPPVPFTSIPNGPFSQARAHRVFNKNGWARSLHFLGAWFFLASWGGYTLFSLATGHLFRNLIPRLRELSAQEILRDIRAHLRLPMPQGHVGPPYGLLQKLTYLGLVLFVLPLMILSGLTMSPIVTAGWPWLLDLFGGTQSARTLHFAGLCLILLYVIVHVAMVALTGFGRQLRHMSWGR